MVDVFVQVRLTSSRVPRKALLGLGADTCLGHVLRRIADASCARHLVLCTSGEKIDDPLVAAGSDRGVAVFRGSADDCLDRYLACADTYKTDVIVRVCGDSPLVDPQVIDGTVELLTEHQFDYVAARNLPVGAYVEAFTYAALERAWLAAEDHDLSDDLTYFLNRPEINVVGAWEPPPELQRGDLVLALNRPEDLHVFQRLFVEARPTGDYLTLTEAIAWLDGHPAVAAYNSNYTPVPTRCDTRLNPSRLPQRPAGLAWYEGIGEPPRAAAEALRQHGLLAQ